MNSQLLRYFESYSEFELQEFALYKSGNPKILNVPVITAEGMWARGKPIHLYKQRRFHFSLDHTHDYIELQYVLKGHVRTIANGDQLDLRSGELLMLNQRAVHVAEPPGEENLSTYLVVQPRFFDRSLDMLGCESSRLRHFLLGCRDADNRESGYMYFRSGDSLPVRNLTENLLHALAFDARNMRNSNEWTMGLLMLQLANLTENEQFDTNLSSLAVEVMQYIEERYADGTLVDLAKKLCYDLKWLSKDIKRLTGSTFTQLLQSKRLSQAKTLLDVTDMPVKAVMQEVGYTSTSNFHTLFKERTGCSPADYRNDKRP